MQHKNNITSNRLSLSEAASYLQLSKPALTQAKWAQKYFIDREYSNNGRYQAFYDIAILNHNEHGRAVLERFNSPELAESQPIQRQPRNDKSIPRRPSGHSRERRIDIERWIVDRAFDIYMNQAQPNDVFMSVRCAVDEYLRTYGPLSGFGTPRHTPPEHMYEFYYQKRIMRNDGRYRGYYHSDQWLAKHRRHWDKRQHQQAVPKNRYDMLSLFTDMGLIGRGFGAAQLWFIDGTQMDAWVTYNGKPVQIYYMLVRCAVTGMPLLVYPIASESTETVIKLIATTYEMYGVPRHGFMLDNSTAFRSAALRGFIRSLYTDDDLARFNNNESPLSRIFTSESQSPPLWFNPPYIPSSPIKSAGERAFRELGRHQSRELAGSWQASPELRARPTIGNTLQPLHRSAVEAEPAFAAFHNWIYSHYINEPRSGALETYRRIARNEGLPLEQQRATILNVWRYYGGENIEPQLAPAEKSAQRYYWMVPNSRNYHHRVEVRYQGALGNVSHQGEMYNYHLPELGEFYGRQVVAVPQLDNPRRAHIYLEYDKNSYDRRVSEDDPIYYIGEAIDHTIRSTDDLELIEARRRNQNIQESRLRVRTDGTNNNNGDQYHPMPEIPEASLMPQRHEQLPEYQEFDGIQQPRPDIHDNPRPDDRPAPTTNGANNSESSDYDDDEPEYSNDLLSKLML